MEELLELKQLLRRGEVDEALLLVEDLEEMGKKGISNNIRSYAKLLLLHLIKQEIEHRTTKSWEASIENCVTEIKYLNQRLKGKGNYLNDEELHDAISEAWNGAFVKASTEVAEGVYETRQIKQMVDEVKLIERAYEMVK
jgi:hypothetical protein